MDRSIKYIIVGLLLIGVGAAVYFMGDTNGNDRAPKETNVDLINWEKNYDAQSNHPFGTYFLHELMDGGMDGFKLYNMDHSVQAYFDHDSLHIPDEKLTYMFIGENLNLYSDEVDSLLQFTSEGNNLFIAAEHFPMQLLNNLLSSNFKDYMMEFSDTSRLLKYTNSPFSLQEYELENTVNGDNLERRWRVWGNGIYSYYDKEVLCKSENKACYIKFSYGAGTILIHTIPQAFTNQYLKSEEGREYIEKALSYLPESVILWDDYTQFVANTSDFELDNEHQSRFERKGGRVNTNSTIAFLLRSKSLRWAYFTILALLVLFVVFMGKRRQKIIPTIRSNNNTSLEFTETISRIYLMQRQHNKLIKHMQVIFRNKMKARYYIAYSDDESYAQRIAKKSGVNEAEVIHLLNMFKQGTQNKEISELFLIELYKALQEFYK